MPNVSVIIPTYKRARIVPQAISSVLAQTYKDYEIIVVNDGSPDNTKVVLAEFGDKIIALHQENQGVSVARNTGIKAANGRYIAFLDDDDLWLPNKLEKQIACLESYPNIGLVYSDIFYFNQKGVLPDTFTKIYPVPPTRKISSLFVQCFIPTPSVVVLRRECLDEIGLFDPMLKTCENYDLWLRLIEKWQFHFLNEPLTLYRQSANSNSSNQEQVLIDLLRVKEKAFRLNSDLQKLPLTVLDECFYVNYLILAYMYICLYQSEKARQFLRRYQKARGNTSTFEWLWMISFPSLKSVTI